MIFFRYIYCKWLFEELVHVYTLSITLCPASFVKQGHCSRLRANFLR